MAGLDLKPLSEEIIKTMEINPHELWLIKLGDEIFGPFESESLKHYAAENEDLFDKALATRMETEDWKPFFGHTLFQRRHPQMVKEPTGQKETLFWLLDQGQKVGPFGKDHLLKSIEQGPTSFVDLVSTDDGHTWHKIFHLEGFDRRFHASSSLPFAPQESELSSAREALIEKIENPITERTSEEFAAIAFHAQVGKVLNFKAEDIPLQPVEEAVLSSNLKWQVPLAIALIVTLVVGVRLMITVSPDASNSETPQLAQVSDRSPPPQAVNNPSRPSNPNGPWKKPPSVLDMPRRVPASAPPGPSYQELQGIQPNYSPPSYTQMESHHGSPTEQEQDQFQNLDQDQGLALEQDQELSPGPDENREPASSEHSLVGGDSNLPDPSLDAAMGNPQPVEEVSDF